MARDHRPAARNAPSAPVAFDAAAALAPTEPPPEETERVEGKAPDSAELVSEIAALRTERDELLARIEAMQSAHAAERDSFDAAWHKREAEIAALSPERVIPAPEAPAALVVPRRPRAVGSLRCHLHGAPLTVGDGQEIPEGVDLSTLPQHAFVEG